MAAHVQLCLVIGLSALPYMLAQLGNLGAGAKENDTQGAAESV
jgi:hypothetical protein